MCVFCSSEANGNQLSALSAAANLCWLPLSVLFPSHLFSAQMNFYFLPEHSPSPWWVQKSAHEIMLDREQKWICLPEFVGHLVGSWRPFLNSFEYLFWIYNTYEMISGYVNCGVNQEERDANRGEAKATRKMMRLNQIKIRQRCWNGRFAFMVSVSISEIWFFFLFLFIFALRWRWYSCCCCCRCRLISWYIS